jgi:hypothetical protein
MGTGPVEAAQRSQDLTEGMVVTFKQSSLAAFLAYATLLAGTPADFPGKVWTIRQKLLQRAVTLRIGCPG